jgi:hypothetical protein
MAVPARVAMQTFHQPTNQPTNEGIKQKRHKKEKQVSLQPPCDHQNGLLLRFCTNVSKMIQVVQISRNFLYHSCLSGHP